MGFIFIATCQGAMECLLGTEREQLEQLRRHYGDQLQVWEMACNRPLGLLNVLQDIYPITIHGTFPLHLVSSIKSTTRKITLLCTPTAMDIE